MPEPRKKTAKKRIRIVPVRRDLPPPQEPQPPRVYRMASVYEPTPPEPTPIKKWSDHLDLCHHCRYAFPAREQLCDDGASLYETSLRTETETEE